jgi:Putative zincin peptidase
MLMQLLATPVGVATATVVWTAWQRLVLVPSLLFDTRTGGAVLAVALILLSFPLMIVVHELLHAVAQPRFGSSDATLIGVWPSRLLFYAHYSGPLSRDRFLGVFVLPFLVMSVLPLLLAAGGALPTVLVFPAAWCSTWNAFFCCGDLLGGGLILSQVPRTAIVQNSGWRTYWKPENTGSARSAAQG